MKVLLDTNIVLRFILKDHNVMSPSAHGLFEKAATGEVELMLDPVTVEDVAHIRDSLELFARYGVDFANAYLAAKARSQHFPIATFDQDFKKLNTSIYPM